MERACRIVMARFWRVAGVWRFAYIRGDKSMTLACVIVTAGLHLPLCLYLRGLAHDAVCGIVGIDAAFAVAQACRKVF